MALKQKKETPKKSNSAEMQRLLDSINKKFGDNAVTLGVPSGDNEVIKRIPTGSVALDVALGGGIPVGRYTEISGGLSTTKSTQCAHIVRNAQKMGYKCAFIDVEATTTREYLRACGVDTDELLYSRPVGLEEATQIVIDMESSGLVQLAVIDSIAALSPTKEQDSKMEESVQMGLVPKLLGEFFRKYQAFNNKLVREGNEPFTLICVNQLREKIGSYGSPEYTPGGRANGFVQSVAIRFRRGDWIVQGTGTNKEIIGQVVKFKIEKNKTYRRNQEGSFDFYYSENEAGVTPNYNDNNKSIIMLGVEWGIIERKGAWFYYADNKYQGIPALVKALSEDENLFEKLKTEVMERVISR